MSPRRALTLVIALVILAAPGLAAAGGFAFAVVGGRLVAVGSGSGAVAVGALGMAMGASTSAGSLGTPIPSLLVVEAVPLDAEIMLDGKAVGTARERASYALDLAPGRHTIRLTAPGHKPLTGRFVADPGGYMTKIRAVLAPE
jgi:PEGA domain-containing protein